MAERPGGNVALVLGGGGLKGFAHIGVLQALEEHGIRPSVVCGTSIGALIAAAHATGMPAREMANRATAFQRRDLFRLDHVGMLMERMRAPSIYQEEPLRATVRDIVPHVRFDEVRVPLLVNTVDVEQGTQVMWGLPGLQSAYVDDAVYASCALPGFFPPGDIGGRVCIDGGTVDNLPVNFARTLGAQLVLAVDVGSSGLTHVEDAAGQGFASTYMRAASIMMNALQLHQMRGRGASPPVLLIRPRIAHIGWFSFGHAEELMDAGYAAAREALVDLAAPDARGTGIFPRRRVRVAVDAAKCTGCGTCAALAPATMALDANRLAYPMAAEFAWSPADGDFVRQCPTLAISAEVLGESGSATVAPRATEPLAVHTEPAGAAAVAVSRTEAPRVKRRHRGA